MLNEETVSGDIAPVEKRLDTQVDRRPTFKEFLKKKKKKINESNDPYKNKQLKDYDCGVASTYSILDYFDIEDREDLLYSDIESKLKTSKSTGTTPENIVKVLNSYDIKVLNGFGEVGIILLNVETLYNDNTEDGENGHWSIYTKVDEGFELYDVWTDKSKIYTETELLEFSINITVKDKEYNKLVYNCTKGN